ncbi:ABC transporter substrate-binding protein [Desulfovibrio ferrophilus]|uniref:ABC transporter substrate binding protein n=1 Tax=Desulfovibrio ferrophilus TaxID=241368 RepID=A0A2Z6AW65_9BACT|nr:ABC transporter substrate-binding protein [Desulfovibrio ferrophilus]BBD07433.1 ABC transporter substrate binding protein precursor [Desulfovibrio ferrophilus]
MKRIITIIMAMAFMVAAVSASAAEIKIGVLSDLSGPTSAVGQPYAEGIKACAQYLNDNGGINGKQVKLLQVDYAYNVQQALAAYKRFKSQGMVALQGWGTADTEALTKFVARDKMPTWSASYSAHLTDPKVAPYNFFVAADYTTQMRAGLKYLKENWKEARAPKLAFIYPDHPYGLSPIKGGKEYAAEIGFEIVGEENVSLKAMDATTQLLALQKKAPDFCWIGGTTPSTSVILKDAKKLSMTTTFLINLWGNDESLIDLAGEAAKGQVGLQAAAVYNDDVPGAALIRERTGGQAVMSHYLRGFASTLVMAEAIKIADAAGNLNGKGIKEAAETLRDFDPMGLTPAISYFADDHRPNMSVNIYTIEGGKLVKTASPTLERKAEWLGH